MPANPQATTALVLVEVRRFYLSAFRAVSVPPDGLVAMTASDSKPLLGIGWKPA